MSYQKEYQQEYYKQNRTKIIAKQLLYHTENREKYLGYMREYNKQYYLKHHVPKPKKIKQPKPPKQPKPVKEPRKKKELPLYTPKEPIYPTRMEKGNFVLEFD